MKRVANEPQTLAEIGDLWAMLPSAVTKSGELAWHRSNYSHFARGGDFDKSSGRGVVGVIPLHGVLTQRGSYGTTSTAAFAQKVKSAMHSRAVKAVVIHVDSPGGSVYGVESASRAIYDARGMKPLYAITDSLNASAALYISSAADRLLVAPGSETGSIGVWSMHVD